MKVEYTVMEITSGRDKDEPATKPFNTEGEAEAWIEKRCSGKSDMLCISGGYWIRKTYKAG